MMSRSRAKISGNSRSSRSGISNEFHRIERIEALFTTTASKQIRIGIGDDAAVLHPTRGDLVWTVDSSVEGVHFRRDWLKFEDIGWRSFQAAASDLAAMGAEPVAALSALELPKDFPDRSLSRFLSGQRDAAAILRCPIVGGNLTSSATFSVTTTVLGRAREPILRSTASVGDELWLVGEVGLAAAGLRCLMGGGTSRTSRAAQYCIDVWRRPSALIGRGRGLLRRAHAAIDISDGLVGDAEHVASASQVAIEIDLDALGSCLRPELVEVAGALSRPSIEFALFGGEDYALLATGAREQRPRWARRIGEVLAGSGVWCRSSHSKKRRLRRGFDHFRKDVG